MPIAEPGTSGKCPHCSVTVRFETVSLIRLDNTEVVTGKQAPLAFSAKAGSDYLSPQPVALPAGALC